MRTRVRTRRGGALLAVGLLVVGTAVWLLAGGWAADPAAAEPLLTDASLGGLFRVSAPGTGDVTDGGLVIRVATGKSLTLLGLTLADGDAPVRLTSAEPQLLPVDADAKQAVGVRQGQPSMLDAGTGAQLRPLAGATVSGKGSGAYEILLALHTPAANGAPWHVSSVTATFRVGSTVRSQTFRHDLTVCAVGNRNPCGDTAGSSTTTVQGHGVVCDTGMSSQVSGKPVDAWLATDQHSPLWQGSGGQINWSTTHSASFTVTASASADFHEEVGFPFKLLDVQVSADQHFGISITSKTTTTTTWAQQVTVPPSAQARRVTVFVKGWALPTTTTTVNRDCSSTSYYGTVYAPANGVSTTDGSTDYCLALDTYPGLLDLGPTCHAE
ncbi:hypothetical protein [Kitasatospora azatica]|uniref:hypothetical protein n=1 Tax=Kitasatospora azatica TaxID=58347 RepID=UPI0012FC5512|nr:hypothetical protein [Kitasatospora azatica]